MNDISPEQSSIGWIGTGIMGAPMCGHLVRAGYRVFVFNRTKEKAGELLSKGAVWCDSPAEVVRQADVIFTIVGYPDDVREVYFGSEGLLTEPGPGRVFVDMTTTEPTLARKIYEKASGFGCASLDAPVSGGDVGAVKGELSIMVGGDEEVFGSVKPLLDLLGKNIVYQGKAGSGQHAKMCNQITVAGVMIGICENLIYCRKAGLDPRTMLRSVGSGAASSWLLNNLGPRIMDGDFDPGFFVEHFIKDMEIALGESQRMGIDLPGLALVKSLYERASALGHGRLGTQALLLALDDLCGDENRN
ncbi:MAG: NAD(P)-dependent oxidoreductase [Candidatus Dadabacteria bacterium]|nr:NAD(P)-dependent oxidoreductase [Candidatus Dadabacteria bacterium]MYA49018.1 NAD(P)-dependent oxidoreductase [Candidatus Dadabacteria bacterium]MYF47426.1 NAD(P)-dependent oxidoreductase [Candidatus Dadabacteria bacterium]MYG82386.1 NAD(P)-dependent oxidoreductase [Candidatus Dadabacteria bacterium]MYK49463.1 NAD(P)-dependent oxidoreductase [Candidatus Dadabacteria bacterium]